MGACEELVGEARTAEALLDEPVDQEVTWLTVYQTWSDVATQVWMDGRPIEVADADDGRLEDGEVLEVRVVGGA